ncbi:hypothetical protein TNCV_1027581 [Trichonephila clavipes]|nr:hypothetical protein TNCV_1027581 [Trichonephila clavipes]
MEITSFQRTPSYRSVPLAANSTNFAYFNTLAKIFAENPARFIHCHDTCNSGLRIRLSMVLLLQEGISGPPFLCYSSRLGVRPRWWKSTPRWLGNAFSPSLSEAPLV